MAIVEVMNLVDAGNGQAEGLREKEPLSSQLNRLPKITWEKEEDSGSRPYRWGATVHLRR